MRYFLSSGRRRKSLSFDESDKLGRGASATVYRVTVGSKIFAAKIYHNDKVINLAKINVMLNEVPKECLVIKDGIEYPQLAWPTDIIYDDVRNPSGILLPLVDTAESFTLDHYYDKGLFKKLGSPDEAALSYKLEIARNLAHVVATLHELGHYIIDCKPQNIRVFKRSHIVTLIDCDGFSINAKGARYPAEMLSTDYIAPEAQRRSSSPSTLVESQDRYALAVILFQLLNQGTHPFQGIITDTTVSFNTNDEKAAAGLYPHGQIPNDKIKPRPESIHHLWDMRTRALFDLAFTSGSPTARPSAKQWAVHFQDLLENKALQRCQKVPNDIEHIRFRDMDCPACYRMGLVISNPPNVRRRSGSTPTPTSVPAGKTNNSQSKSSNPIENFMWVILAIFIITIIFFQLSPQRNETAPVPVPASPATPPTVPESSGKDAHTASKFINENPQNFGERVNYLERHTYAAGRAVSFSTFISGQDEKNRRIAIDLINDILEKMSEADKTAVRSNDSQILTVNLYPISEITFYGTDNEICPVSHDENDLAQICVVKGFRADCHNTVRNQHHQFKFLCIGKFMTEY